MLHSLPRLVVAMALGLPLLSAAQGRPDPANPHAPARPLAYGSAFAGYQPFQDLPPADWRRLNDAVGRAALKTGAGAPEPVPAATTAPAQKPTHQMPAHRHHHHPGGHP